MTLIHPYVAPRFEAKSLLFAGFARRGFPRPVKLDAPAFIDCMRDNIKVFTGNAPDEENPDVVFHSHEFGVVHPGFLG